MNQIFNFFHDCDARIPFSVIGVILLIGSSFTGVVFSELQTDRIMDFVNTSKTDDLSVFISQAESDIGRMVNIIGSRSLAEIAHNPVVESASDLPAEKVNQIRLKKRIIEELNIYLINNYHNDQFNNGYYSINVIPDDEMVALQSIDEITLHSVNMRLKRNFHLPFLGPYQIREYPTYWKVCFSLPVQIRVFESKEIDSYERVLDISTVIMVRYPLLKELVDEYNETINGLGPLWTTTSLISNLYSLARGYKHYQSGKPANVVDNKHLAPIINGALLFEEGLVFGSIDPGFLIECMIEIQQSLMKQDASSKIDNCNDLTDDVFSFAVSTFSDIPLDKDDDSEETHQPPIVNVTDIAMNPLYFFQQKQLHFSNQQGLQRTEIFIDPTAEQIQRCIESYVSDGFILDEVTQDEKVVNQSTTQHVRSIIELIYTASFSTQVKRDDSPDFSFGDHQGYPIDNGSSKWSLGASRLLDIIEKPEKGSIEPGSSVYTEIYEVIWTRDHTWSKKEYIHTENETIIEWDSITVTDVKRENDVGLHVFLEYYGNNHSVCDIGYYSTDEHDPNLEDTIDSYISSVFHPAVSELLQSENGRYYFDSVTGRTASWVEERVWIEFDRLFHNISKISVSEKVNISNYPHPIDLITAARDDLLNQFDMLTSSFIQRNRFWNHGCLRSSGWNAVYSLRLWYIKTVEHQIETFFNKLIMELTTQLSLSIKSIDGVSGNDVKQALSTDTVGSLGDLISIPLGSSLDLVLLDDSSTSFKEKILLAVDHEPNYLNPFNQQDDEPTDNSYIQIENICSLGPTGLPLLPPSPATPWIVTLNVWIIRIKGCYNSFQLSDCNQETVFHPLIGHVPLVYCRKEAEIYDDDGTLLGYNKPLSFSLDLVACSVVPSWGMMTGDIKGGLIERDGKS